MKAAPEQIECLQQVADQHAPSRSSPVSNRHHPFHLGQQRFWDRRAGVGKDQRLLLVARYRGDLACHGQAAGQPRHALAPVVRGRQVLGGEEPQGETPGVKGYLS